MPGFLPAKTDYEGRFIRNALSDATAVKSDQATSADATTYHLPPIGASTTGERRAMRPDQIEFVSAAAIAAGESINYVVKRLRAGVLQTIGSYVTLGGVATPATLDSTTGTRRVLVLDDKYEFDDDDLLVLVRDYTAGGGPTMTANLVRITWKLPI